MNHPATINQAPIASRVIPLRGLSAEIAKSTIRVAGRRPKARCRAGAFDRILSSSSDIAPPSGKTARSDGPCGQPVRFESASKRQGKEIAFSVTLRSRRQPRLESLLSVPTAADLHVCPCASNQRRMLRNPARDEHREEIHDANRAATHLIQHRSAQLLFTPRVALAM